jgi:hypothetical protein
MRRRRGQWGPRRRRGFAVSERIAKATTTQTKGKGKEAALAEQLIAGSQKHLATLTQVLVDGSSYTPAQAEAQLQAFANLRNDVDTARAALKAKLADETAKAPGLRVFFIAFIQFVRAAFGTSPDVMADFGLQPKKARAPLTTEQKAAAAAKRAATRKARGTTGKRKKLAVKGNVTGVDITPITTSAASTPAQTAPSTSAESPTTGTPPAK